MLIVKKEKSNWKDKVSKSEYLKDYYKHNKNLKHPVFGEAPKFYKCMKCDKRAEFMSFKNGQLEWAYCREHYGKYGKPKSNR